MAARVEPGSTFSSAGPTPLAEATVVEFWQWAFGDLSGNTERGALAEFIVARALGAEEPSVVWSPFDVVAPWGAKVEVKTSAYVQQWPQPRPSVIRWSIAKTSPWSDDIKGWVAGESQRHADVYVLCLLHEQDRELVDPLNLAQWSFYVLPTATIEAEFGDAKSVGIRAIERVAEPLRIDQLLGAVRRATEPDLDARR